MSTHRHVTEEWKGCAPRTIATLDLDYDTRKVFDEQVRILRDVIGMSPREEGVTGTMRTQILDSTTEDPRHNSGWVTIRMWDCTADACGLTYHKLTPPTDRADWYARALGVIA